MPSRLVTGSLADTYNLLRFRDNFLQTYGNDIILNQLILSVY